jgi:hypothetical protein
MSENRLMSALGPSIDCVVTAADDAAGRARAAMAAARAARVRRVMQSASVAFRAGAGEQPGCGDPLRAGATPATGT